jgi:RNA polymerase sigma-70 factor, ECF subfamily
MINATDEVLMQRLQNNDLESFKILYLRHKERILRFYQKRYPRKAEDLLQECMMRLLERRDQWNGSVFIAWLFVMARNLMIDEMRKDKLRDQVQPRSDNNEMDMDIMEWLEEISEEEKHLIFDRYFRGLSFQELSQKYATSEVSLRQKVSRILKSLRQELV